MLNFPSRWIPLWEKYFSINKSSLDEKVEHLCDGLDCLSSFVVKTIINRYRRASKLMEDASLDEIDEISFRQWETQQRIYVDQKIEFAKSKYHLPVDNYEEAVFGYDSGLFYLNEHVDLKKHLGGSVFIDGGAYVGDTLLILLKYKPSQIILFEPDSINIRHLKWTIKENTPSIGNMVLVEAGMGEKNCTKGFKEVGGSSSSFLRVNEEDEINQTVNVWALDSYLEKRTDLSERVGLIKLDVQGYEWATIQGAIETLKLNRPIVLISLYHTPEDFFEIKPYLQKELASYQFIIRKLNPNHPTHETMLIGFPKEMKTTN
ncbi:MAG: FkbM family methyltransferase [Opitutales bacterium]|nr:FkbM family methyltransferase [Opitutales bacterium]